MIWLESPSNPLLEVADVERICAAPRRDGARLVVDNTFATPLLQRPLELGADVAVHSATKFIGGHSDLLLGVAVARDAGVAERLRATRGLTGATPGALEAFLALRGVRTLPLRLRQASATAAELAERLGAHQAVARVRYPGFGAVVSFELPTPPRPTGPAGGRGSSATPRASAAWTRTWSVAARTPARSTSRRA